MIFYFSATGNCKMIAETISKKTGEKTVAIKDCMQNNDFSFECGEGETIGFVTPTYFWGLPSVVSDFVKFLDIKHTETFTHIRYRLTEQPRGNRQNSLPTYYAKKAFRYPPHTPLKPSIPGFLCII